VHQGFRKPVLKRWLTSSGMEEVSVEELGHDPKAPHLTLLLGLGVKG